jgi:hypothetical protein
MGPQHFRSDLRVLDVPLIIRLPGGTARGERDVQPNPSTAVRTTVVIGYHR